MNKKVCNVCGTENEEEYKYCKNCGNTLGTEYSTKEPQTEAQTENRYESADNTDARWNIVNNYDGVSAEEMAIFIGKKSNKILPKFSKMQITNSKISWNWPAAILGYILGPMGSALWFFYRKMYKPAIILSLIGAVLMVISGFMTLGTGDFLPEAALEAFLDGDFEDAVGIINSSNINLTNTQKIMGAASTFLSEIINIATCLSMGIFGYFIYKEHCIKKITEYKAFDADTRFYKIGLASVGGQSGGMLAVGIIILLVAQSIVDFVATVYSIIL